jgi:DNA-binding transcriptional LysR family regulator
MQDWNDLRYVLAIARARGATEAARCIGVHPSTVFRRLNALEEGLGVRLYERLPEGYLATSAGEEICRLAEKIEEDIAVLSRRLAGRDLRPSGTVHVTTTDTLVALLAPYFADFRKANPEVELRVTVANRFFDLTRHEADVAIRPATDPPNPLVGRRLAKIATAIYASHDYLAGRDEPLELSEHEWIGPDESLSHLASWRWLRQSFPAASIRYRFNSLMAGLAAAKAGLGVVTLPCFLGDVEPTLRRVRPPLPALENALWLLTHKDLRHVARVRALLDFMAAGLAAERPLLEGAGEQEKGARGGYDRPCE